jgi:hypothetical protein
VEQETSGMYVGAYQLERRLHGGSAGFYLGMIGFAPIAALCAALFGVLPLHLSTRFIVLPGVALALVVGLRSPAAGRRALTGLVVGIVATAVYDCLRLAGVAAGLWHDFIPVIGQLALDDPSASPLWGYAWRFALNGGGMCLSFALLPWRGLRVGLLFGASVCLCLFATLVLAPAAQGVLFFLNPTTATLALAGHLLYGGICGWLLGRCARQGRPEQPALARPARR